MHLNILEAATHLGPLCGYAAGRQT